MAYTTIDKPSDYFNTVLYTGTGSSQTPSNGWQPDLSVIKVRSLGTQGWVWADRVRGDEKTLKTNGSDAEETRPNAFSGWTSDGITVVSEGRTNNSGETYANWNWLAGGTTASNTDGSITSTVSANTTSGFSIVSWTGSGANATIGHGLGAEPKMIFLKIRTGTNNWQVYNKSIGSGNALFLNTTDASSSNTGWQSTDATSSVFYVSGGTAVNGSGQDMIAYCFAEKSGYSSIGQYTGNGSTDGTFVYTGFKPSFYMTKRTDTTSNWHIYDAKRDIDNSVRAELRANTIDAEVDVERVDFLSNGIKTRNTGSAMNTSGGTYIYMAFAESPFVTSTGIPTTAR